MKLSLLVGIACTVAMGMCLPVSRAWAQDEDTVHFHDRYAEALREAKRTHKPLFLVFRCAP